MRAKSHSAAADVKDNGFSLTVRPFELFHPFSDGKIERLCVRLCNPSSNNRDHSLRCDSLARSLARALALTLQSKYWLGKQGCDVGIVSSVFITGLNAPHDGDSTTRKIKRYGLKCFRKTPGFRGN